MAAYYNEHDKYAAAWLRELIKAGLIADGEVDERSIEDVIPSELAGFTQCHFFAGIGVWSYALRQAGWSDNQPVWTGSCPCQPFSAAGKGAGFDDERHLWPAFYHLISQCQPNVVFGEQVASKDGLAWLDLVQADLEGAGYAVGAADICAAGFGAPHIRQRLYWVGYSQSAGLERFAWNGNHSYQSRRFHPNSPGHVGTSSVIHRLADAKSPGEQRELGIPASTGGERDKGFKEPRQLGSTLSLANAKGNRRGEGQSDGGGHSVGNGAQGTTGRTAQFGEPDIVGISISPRLEGHSRDERNGHQPQWHNPSKTRPVTSPSSFSRPGPVNGFWRDADWLQCRDGKWRSVKSGTFPLVDGTPARVGRLRGYGNAIVAPVAQAFIEAYLDVTKENR